MNEARTTMHEHPKVSEAGTIGERSVWAAGLACGLSFGITILLLNAYSLLHWRTIRDHYSTLDEPLKSDLIRLLGHLEVYHFTALLAVIFGAWTFRGQPRWMRWVCLPLSILALLMFAVVV